MRRTSDRGLLARTEDVVKRSSFSFWHWVERHHIDSLSVLLLALYLSFHVVHWAISFPYDVAAYRSADIELAEQQFSGTDVAAIIAAVLTPWGLAQAALFKFYMDLRRDCHGEPK